MSDVGYSEIAVIDENGASVWDSLNTCCTSEANPDRFETMWTQGFRLAALDQDMLVYESAIKIPHLQLKLLLAMSQHDLVVDTKPLIVRSLIGSLLMFLLVAIFMTLAITALTRPITSLAQAAQAIGQGKYDIELKTKLNDEVAQLVLNFNKMAGEIKLRTAQLENKIREQRDFLALISHELKTPISAIRWSVELIKGDSENQLSETSAEMLDSTEESTEKCGGWSRTYMTHPASSAASSASTARTATRPRF